MVTAHVIGEFPKFGVTVSAHTQDLRMENAQRQERKRRVGIVGFGRLGEITAD